MSPSGPSAGHGETAMADDLDLGGLGDALGGMPGGDKQG